MGRLAKQISAHYGPIRKDIFKLCEALNYKPTAQQRGMLELVQRGEPRIAVKSGQGPGKCISGNAEIYDVERGALRRIGDMEGDSLKVISKDSQGKLGIETAECFSSGRKPCVRVHSHSGAWVDTSTDHPFFTQRGWVEAEDLCDGDLLAMPRSLDLQEEHEIDDHVVLLAAYLGSDGSTSSGVGFTNMTPEVLLEFEEAVSAAGGSCKDYPSTSRARQLGVSGILPLVRFFDYKGCLSKNKRVPPWTVGLSKRQIALFLNRFWACDGYVEKDGFAIVLASEGLIRDLQTLLLRLGIFSNFRYKASKCEGETFDAWRLSVRGSDAVRFYEDVGPILAKENRSKALYKTLKSKPRNTNTDVVPIRRAEMVEICEELQIVSQRGRAPRLPGLSLTDVRCMCRGRTHESWISREKFAAFCEISGYSGKHAWLATSDIRWTKFDRTESLGILPVFDLSVPATGNFVAQNLVVHNTATTGVAGLWRALRHAHPKTEF